MERVESFVEVPPITSSSRRIWVFRRFSVCVCVEYLTEPRSIIWLSDSRLDDRRVNLCLVQLAAGLSRPRHLSPPLPSTLRRKQGSFSHHIPHSCITIEPCCACCSGSGRQEERWAAHTLIEISAREKKVSLQLYDKSLSALSVCARGGTCAEAQSAINLSTCCQRWKVITHNDGALFLYCYSKDHSIQVLSDIWKSVTF